MKPTVRTIFLSAALSPLALIPSLSHAGVSAEIGAVSDYVFRGAQQTNGNNQPQWQGGLDYENAYGFYAGAWGSTLFNIYGDDMTSEGLEYDLYAGWQGSITPDFGLKIGTTYYNYTDADVFPNGKMFGTFKEINLGVDYSIVSLAFDIGYDDSGAKTEHYQHYAIAFDLDQYVPGFGITYGFTKMASEAPKAYLDFGYTGQFYGFIFGANVIYSNKHNDDDTYLLLSVKKEFQLME